VRSLTLDSIKAFEASGQRCCACCVKLESLKAGIAPATTFWNRQRPAEQMHSELTAAGFATQPQPEGTGRRDPPEVDREAA